MKPESKTFLKRWLHRMAWLPILVVLFVVLLELFYRNQWIDTYRRELTALNSQNVAGSPRKKVLVMGDSFTAAPNSWVNVLRKRHPDLQFINSAVPGTTIYQANLMLAGRMQTFKPDLLIYQVYVGNDLFDLRYPTNWFRIGLGRNIYWSLANRFRSLSWLNYAMGQLKRAANAPDFAQGKVDEGPFNPLNYSERERLYLKAEPGMIVDQVLLRGDRADDMKDYLELFQEFLGTAKTANCPVIVLVIPHCAQVNWRYAEQMKRIGATGMDDFSFRFGAYDFWNEISAYDSETVDFLDALPSLMGKETESGPTYYLHDAHLNDAGQETIADLVEPWLWQQ